MSWHLWMIFIKLHPNVHLHSWAVWRTNNPLCRLKVKVTLQCHGIYPSISCLIHTFTHHNLLNPLNFFEYTSPKCSLSGTVCRVHDSDTQIQDQGHTSRSCSNIPLNFVLLHISPKSFEWFTLNFTQILVRQCAEPMAQLCRLKVNVILPCN